MRQTDSPIDRPDSITYIYDTSLWQRYCQMRSAPLFISSALPHCDVQSLTDQHFICKNDIIFLKYKILPGSCKAP